MEFRGGRGSGGGGRNRERERRYSTGASLSSSTNNHRNDSQNGQGIQTNLPNLPNPLNPANPANPANPDSSSTQDPREDRFASTYDMDNPPTTMETLRFIMPFFFPSSWKLRMAALISVMLTIMSKLANLAVPLCLRYVVDSLTAAKGIDGSPSDIDNVNTATAASTNATATTTESSSPLPSLQDLNNVSPISFNSAAHAATVFIILYSTLRFLGLFFSEMRGYCWQLVSLHVTRDFSVSTFQHLHQLSLSYHLKRKTGEVLRVMDRGVSSLSTLLQLFAFTIGPTLLELVLTCAVFVHLETTRIAVIVFISAIIYAAFSVMVTQWRTKIRRELIDKDNDVTAKATDSLINFETVKYFVNEQAEVSRYDSLLKDYQDTSLKTQFSLGILNSGQGFIINAAICLGLLVAGRETMHGSFSVGDFVMINAYIIQLYQPLAWLGTAYRSLNQAFTDLEKMMYLRGIINEVPDVPNATDFEYKQGDIKFENVSFHYGSASSGQIDNLSFHVKPGKSLGIVGATGSGKSTVLRLLFRFYDVLDGRVLVDGQDIRYVKQATYRRHIGVVAQDTVLFNDTLKYNIEYGKLGASDKEIRAAIEVAQLGGFIEKCPKGLDTEVGERGLRLSGGEKQRVGIARMVLKNPGIILLDEATSALDTNTERAIQGALRAARKGRTAIVIAHRLSTIVDADEILVLSEGKAAERGSFSQLMSNKDGVFYGMWMAQQEKALTIDATDSEISDGGDNASSLDKGESSGSKPSSSWWFS